MNQLTPLPRLPLAQQVVVNHELSELVGHKDEKVLPGAGHDVLRDGVLGRLHPHAARVRVQLHQDGPDKGGGGGNVT